MSHLDAEVLAAAGLAEPVDATDAAHLAECVSCQAAVADLRRTHQLARSARAAEPWEAPPPTVLAAVLATIEQDPPHSEPAGEPAEGGAGEGPPVASPRADVTALPAEPPRSRRAALGWLVGVAAAGVVIGWAGSRVLGDRPDPAPSATAVATVVLTTLDTNQPRGVATVLQAGSATELEVTTDELGSTPGYFEVWLINIDGERMVSVGVLDGTSATFPISEELLAEGYRIVDVSREQFDEKPAHSGDSVVRGTLPV